MVDWFQTSIMACVVEWKGIAISQKIGVDCCRLETRWKGLIFAKAVWRDFAFWAATIVGTGHKGLFQIISNEYG
jgi:hypothetical protein